MTRYTATIKHHSIARSDEVPVGDTLTQAKRNATKEFGKGFIGHEIIIFDNGTEYLPEAVAFRRIGYDARWTNVEDL